MPCALRRKVPGCVSEVRIEVSRAAWSKHWRQCVWLTCPTRAALASRCSKRTARKLPRCGAGAPAKSTYCDLSSFGPALFEICWPDTYLGGPYGPVKDEMYWPELAQRSEKCAGPAGQCLCLGLQWQCLPVTVYPKIERAAKLQTFAVCSVAGKTPHRGVICHVRCTVAKNSWSVMSLNRRDQPVLFRPNCNWHLCNGIPVTSLPVISLSY